MKTVIRLDITDAQRNALAQLLAGKPVKRLATREEVAAYVVGLADQLGAGTPPVIDDTPPPPCFKPKPEVADIPTDELVQANRAASSAIVAGRLTEEGRVSYVRGFVNAGRRSRLSGRADSASERQGD